MTSPVVRFIRRRHDDPRGPSRPGHLLIIPPGPTPFERGRDRPPRRSPHASQMARASGLLLPPLPRQEQFGLEAVGLDLEEVEAGERPLLGERPEPVLPG